MMIVLAMAAAMAGAPDGSQAPAPAPGPAPAAARPADDRDRIVCRQEEVTGSKFTRRVCMTKGQWDEQSRDAERFERRMNEIQMGTGGGATGGT